jgi:hypothetical protein
MPGSDGAEIIATGGRAGVVDRTPPTDVESLLEWLEGRYGGSNGGSGGSGGSGGYDDEEPLGSDPFKGVSTGNVDRPPPTRPERGAVTKFEWE